MYITSDLQARFGVMVRPLARSGAFSRHLCYKDWTSCEVRCVFPGIFATKVGPLTRSGAFSPAFLLQRLDLLRGQGHLLGVMFFFAIQVRKSHTIVLTPNTRPTWTFYIGYWLLDIPHSLSSPHGVRLHHHWFWFWRLGERAEVVRKRIQGIGHRKRQMVSLR